MNAFTKHNVLIDQAISSFGQQTGLSIHSETTVPERSSVLLWVEGVNKPFEAYVKSNLTQQNVSSVIYELSQVQSQAKPEPSKILIAPYINPNLMDKLREAKVPCIDSAGNAFIQKQPVYVFVKGNKPTSEATLIKKGRAFQYAGLKVVFALLQNPALIQQTYREIAECSGVALGGVGGILDDLMQQGYIRMRGKNRRLQDRKGLLTRWVEEYPILKQKHLLGSFTTDNPLWWKDVDIASFEGVWGGEIAAEIYTRYLQAKDGAVFIPQEKMAALMKSAHLKKRQSGDNDAICIELIEPFWIKQPEHTEGDLAPALLVYADLIHSKDARNLETANRIYEQYLD